MLICWLQDRTSEIKEQMRPDDELRQYNKMKICILFTRFRFRLEICARASSLHCQSISMRRVFLHLFLYPLPPTPPSWSFSSSSAVHSIFFPFESSIPFETYDSTNLFSPPFISRPLSPPLSLRFSLSLSASFCLSLRALWMCWSFSNPHYLSIRCQRMMKKRHKRRQRKKKVS